ncbi:helicase [Candidatus Poribacteria bacterium]|nr:helicase [Candidatus Poribacteria bacterium]MYK21948.1 helicase [Candidatus Poribacteria bacterium]
MNNTSNPSTEFARGQIVFLKADPSTRGAVVDVSPGTPENQIHVFVGQKVHTFYPSQLQLEVQDDSCIFACDDFHAYLTALQIQYPGLSTLYSLNAARVDFIPYQYRPVLKFIKADLPRLLIADSVGVGKTIEAGLILRELQARSEINSVLIICPRPLVAEQKWQREMKRFDENFEHLDGKTLQYCLKEMHLDGEWPERYQKAILPYSLLNKTLLFGPGGTSKKKTGKGLLDLDPPPHFDLVIVDEAHHIRNQGTANHEAVRFFCENANAAVFLTATPIQLGSHDLYVLLNVLRPDLILDEESFNHMAEPNPFINQAVDAARAQESGWIQSAKESLDHASATAWGQSISKNDPEFKQVRKQLARGHITPEGRVQLITDMEALHTFSGIINRTRRRDIGEFTIRRSRTVEVALTTEQEELHEALLETQAEIFRSLHGDQSVNFMMTTLRRQLASCLHGLEPLLEDILNRRLDELEWTEADALDAMPTPELTTHIREHVQTLLEKAKNLDPKDLKLEALRKIVRERQNLQNNKVMIFSSFRHTLSYLHKNLMRDGFRVAQIHGGTPDEERLELRERFEKPRSETDSLDLMLFSEVGCEGLDYQFCDCIVNYDLPWNPMKIEQRIGRIDRRGQKSESVAIINLITPDTVDADIYERCLLRIGVFESALGGSEEILGEVTTELRNIAEDYGLTEEERRTKLQQLEDNQIRLIQEHEELEAQQLDLFGLRFPEDKMEKEVEDASSYWLSPKSIQRLVTRYLRQKIGAEQEFILGEKPLKTLRLSEGARNTLLADFQQFSREKARVYRDWEKWLKGSGQHLSITFEADCATQHPDAMFIMPTHPLVKQAAATLNAGQEVVTTLKVKTSNVPSGRYEFAIYQWRFLGIREHLVLKPIASSEVLTPCLNDLLERAVDSDTQGNQLLTKKDELEKEQQKLWAEARANHRERTQALADYRKESLSTSYQKQRTVLDQKLIQATDPNIQRMRRSQLDNAKVDYQRRIEEFNTAIAQADITSEPVAYGVLEVE